MQRKNKNGFVVAIDGPDGVGKTTQVELLANYMKAQKRTVYTTRSSGGTPIGEELRKASHSNLPRPAETDLYISLAMAEASGEEISKHKQAGDFVIIDRSPLTIIAYNGYGSQLKDQKKAFEAAEHIYKLWRIDLLIFLNADQKVLDERRHTRNLRDYFESQDAVFHKRVREGYKDGLQFLERTKKQLKTEVIVLDSSQQINVVHKGILGEVHKEMLE